MAVDDLDGDGDDIDDMSWKMAMTSIPARSPKRARRRTLSKRVSTQEAVAPKYPPRS
jgi:hypothetical protein